jgi:hypothetical protein
VTVGQITAGQVRLDVKAGDLSLTNTGQLSGSLDLGIAGAPAALTKLAQSGIISTAAAEAMAKPAQSGRGVVRFRGGRTYLDAVAIGPAPRVF